MADDPLPTEPLPSRTVMSDNERSMLPKEEVRENLELPLEAPNDEDEGRDELPVGDRGAAVDDTEADEEAAAVVPVAAVAGVAGVGETDSDADDEPDRRAVGCEGLVDLLTGATV